jgi:arylsulfatase A-like enzyme
MPAKNSPTEKGLRTPMFVTWPKGGVPGGQRIDSLNYALDLHATALDYAGLQVPINVASKSLRPQIEGKSKEPHDTIFGAVYAHAPHAYPGKASAKRCPQRDLLALYARTSRWKYVLYTQDVNVANERYVWMIKALWDSFVRHRGDQDLFDLSVDPYEQNNLANLAEHEERIAALRRQALTWWKGTGGGPLEVSGVKVLRKIEK